MTLAESLPASLLLVISRYAHAAPAELSSSPASWTVSVDRFRPLVP